MSLVQMIASSMNILRSRLMRLYFEFFAQMTRLINSVGDAYIDPI